MEDQENDMIDEFQLMADMEDKAGELVKSSLLEINRAYEKVLEFDNRDEKFSFLMNSLTDYLVQWAKSLIRSRASPIKDEEELAQFCYSLSLANHRLILGTTDVIISLFYFFWNYEFEFFGELLFVFYVD